VDTLPVPIESRRWISAALNWWGAVCRCQRVANRQQQPSHYHFGDSDPADDLARPQAGPGGSKYAGTSAGGSALADLDREAQAFGLAVRSGVVTHRRRLTSSSQSISSPAEGELTQASADRNADPSGECLVADR
jgi:hypothetical protein